MAAVLTYRPNASKGHAVLHVIVSWIFIINFAFGIHYWADVIIGIPLL